MQLADMPGFPDPQDYYANHHAFKLTPKQKVFIGTVGDDHQDYQPPYKRTRRSEASFDQVDFDAYVYTRDRRDVDELFSDPKAPENPVEVVYKNTPPIPRPGGILRSVENFVPVQRSFPQPIQLRTKSPPKRSCTHASVDFRDDRTAEWRARPPLASPGFEVVNTSGFKHARTRTKMTFDEWDTYVEAMNPKTYRPTPGDQLLDELQDKRQREVQAWALNAKFRPHGGMARAVSFGEWIGSQVLNTARQYFGL
jgi:hypothetical protein